MISGQPREPRIERRAEADLQLRHFFAKKLRGLSMSRPQFVERLSEHLGEPVSLSRLDSYIASTKVSARLPAYFLRAICEVLDSDEILLYLARPCVQKKVELAEQLRELRRLCDELLWMPELNAKQNARLSSAAKQPKPPGNGIPAEKRNRNGSCAR